MTVGSYPSSPHLTFLIYNTTMTVEPILKILYTLEQGRHDRLDMGLGWHLWQTLLVCCGFFSDKLVGLRATYKTWGISDQEIKLVFKYGAYGENATLALRTLRLLHVQRRFASKPR